jgi:NSS family neurotransmitter:Na+ symporter
MLALKAAKPLHGHWSSPVMLFLAAAGFAIGLKSLWLFPHNLALYGGSAYLLAHAFFLLVLGVPLLMSQLMLGRLGHGSPVNAMNSLVRRSHTPHAWRWLGLIAVLAGFLILVNLEVIAGWFLAYIVRAASGALGGLTAEGAESVFTALMRDPEKQLFWHGLFVVMTMLPLAYGLRGGLERVVRVAVPAIALLLVLMVGYAAGSGQFWEAFKYFLRLDFSQLGFDGTLVALGSAFFSLGLGVGTFMLYGAYLSGQGPVWRLSLAVVLASLLAGVLAGVAFYPVLFAGGGVSTHGPGLVFQALPVAYDALPLGAFMRVLLFILLALIAWVSALALTEPVLAWFTEQRNITRLRAVLYLGGVTWLLGALSILSLHVWSFNFSLFGVSRGLGLFDVLVVLTTYLLLPVVGIGVALYAGWMIRPEISRDALAIRSRRRHRVWLWLNRIVIPVMLASLFFGFRLFL